jgi:hypothetical protein
LPAEARPGLAQVALALARLVDDPRAVNQQAAAAKTLAMLLDRLRSASARGRRGGHGTGAATSSGTGSAGTAGFLVASPLMTAPIKN